MIASGERWRHSRKGLLPILYGSHGGYEQEGVLSAVYSEKLEVGLIQ
jgi:hypothetical protein